MRIVRLLTLPLVPALLAGCMSVGAGPATPIRSVDQAGFWARLVQLCGSAYEGRLVQGNASDTTFARQRVVMHARSCGADSVAIALHVGENRSRTWIVSRVPGGLRLKHVHRHEDGAEDSVSRYGGDTRDAGSARVQEFPADAFTARLLPPAATNVWTMEVDPGRAFAYMLRREGTDRRFRLEFDLSRPVAPPPPPWGG